MPSALAIDALHPVALPSADLARSVAFRSDVLGLPGIAQFAPPFGAAGQGEWMEFFRDPDGILLALAARMRRRSA
jgi:catechol 2,3-dioxygenase-like lactoylglutathione lyase family enzyme